MSVPLMPELVVNGEVVPRAAIAAEAQNHPAPPGKPGIAWRKAANALAVRTLLLQEARRRGIAAAPAEVAPGRFESDEEAQIRALLDAAVHFAPPVSAAVRAEWERDPTRFRSAPLWEVSHILVACDPTDEEARQAARVRAEAIASQLADRPEDFVRLAREHSDCPSKAAGGSLGQIRPGDTVPEFESALRDLQAGQITPAPVLTRHGWHLIRMDAVAEGEVLPFEAARDRLRDAMEKAAWARAARDFVAGLAAAASISGADLRPENRNANHAEGSA